ncbi:hypothetical protein SPHINGO391_170001 [Sphingomonas aurantiaca]|uniref:Uncharacterized protein n=1 Tax=Sphingomonas aurantiaca TaxID=185949 RepID=A0A5E7XTC4_9SPHN|nr:hypothetical protein SPHINGO391_170001 [Sphingomonas aurantiaca]
MLTIFPRRTDEVDDEGIGTQTGHDRRSIFTGEDMHSHLGTGRQRVVSIRVVVLPDGRASARQHGDQSHARARTPHALRHGRMHCRAKVRHPRGMLMMSL